MSELKNSNVPGHTMRMRAPSNGRHNPSAFATEQHRRRTMGITFAKLFQRLFSKKEMRILMVRQLARKRRTSRRISRARSRMSNPATRRHSGSLASRRPVRRARSFVERREWIEQFFIHSFRTRSSSMRRRARRRRQAMGDRSRSDGSVRCCVGAPPMWFPTEMGTLGGG